MEGDSKIAKVVIKDASGKNKRFLLADEELKKVLLNQITFSTNVLDTLGWSRARCCSWYPPETRFSS